MLTRSPITADTVARRCAGLTGHPIDDEVLLYDATRHATHRLNCTAHFIWEHCDGVRTLRQIVEMLTARWAAPVERVLSDAIDALATMEDNALIEITDP